MRRRRSRTLTVLALSLAAIVAISLVSLSVLRIRAEAAAGRAVTIPASLVPTAPAPRLQSAVFIGDSYSAGAGGSGYNNAFVTLVSAYEGWTFQNLAAGGTGYITSAERSGAKACGASYCPSYPEVIARVKSANPTLVVVSGGRNDLNKPDAALRRGIPSFYEALRQAVPDAKIYATSPLYDTKPAPAQLGRIAAEVKAAVTSVHGVYLDIGEPLQGRADRIAGDGVHPNDSGHAAIAQAVEVAFSRLPVSEKP